MDKKKYHETQNKILEIGKAARYLRLDEFIDQINVAEAVAPMTDPAMYQAAYKNLQIVKKMARALIEFQNSLPDERDILDGLMAAHQYKQTHSGL